MSLRLIVPGGIWRRPSFPNEAECAGDANAAAGASETQNKDIQMDGGGNASLQHPRLTVPHGMNAANPGSEQVLDGSAGPEPMVT